MRIMNPYAPKQVITVFVCCILQPTRVSKQSDQQDIRSISWMEVFNPHHLRYGTAVQLWTDKEY